MVESRDCCCRWHVGYSEGCRYGKLLGKHPVRISIPVSWGFLKALKVAASLRFTVKLIAHQPASDSIPELLDAARLFLHQTEVSQPIEFFNGSMLAFYRQDSSTLWWVQEEDPADIRYIRDDGSELDFGLATAKQLECESYEYLGHCQGYIKRPDRDFDCAGVKEVFRLLRAAATELRDDLDTFALSREDVLP